MVNAFVPLGDQAVLVSLRDENSALQFAEAVRQDGAAWVIDVVQAYTTVAVFYDPTLTRYEAVTMSLRTVAETAGEVVRSRERTLHLIPCCYAFGPDLPRVAEETHLSADEVIRLHAGTVYTIYAIGFCPGFPYLGYLPDELSGVPRLATPRLLVEAGSVGLTGRQTGIYTEERPGGWNLIGRTPLQLVEMNEAYFPLRTGDRVRFHPIDEVEFDRLRGQRLRTH